MRQRSGLMSKTARAFAIAGLSIGLVQMAGAAGFALIEQSVPGMGTAYAGAAATADSVDTLYFNPAGMTRLPGTQTGAAVHLVKPKTEFNNKDSRFVTTAPIQGGDGGDAGGLAAVPHFYLTHQVGGTTWLGLAVNAPFGLKTEYDGDWVGRYHAIKSEVKTVNINPSIGLRVNDQLSIAVGASAMHLEGEFTNAIDFGLLVDPALAGTLDGKSKIEGDSWGWGFNLGALFEPSVDTRIGVHFRSEVSQDIEGDAKFKRVPGALQPAFSDTDVKADVDLPASVSVSGFHQLNAEWAIVGDYTWTDWSSIPELRFKFDNSLPDQVTSFDWRDTSRLSLGGIYTPQRSVWSYRFGVAYDESPVRNAKSRSARLPDNDRIWVSIGAGCRPREKLRVDVGYAHLFIDDAQIRKTASGEDRTRGALNGSYNASVDILSIEAQYQF